MIKFNLNDVIAGATMFCGGILLSQNEIGLGFVLWIAGVLLIIKEDTK